MDKMKNSAVSCGVSSKEKAIMGAAASNPPLATPPTAVGFPGFFP